MMAYPSQTLTSLGQLCTALWDSQSQPVVIQPGIEPGPVVTPLVLRCSALNRCANREPSTGYHTLVSVYLHRTNRAYDENQLFSRQNETNKLLSISIEQTEHMMRTSCFQDKTKQINV